MKIAVCGSQCTGKTTFIIDFIKQWSMYKLCERPRYSELIKEKNIKIFINEDGDEDSQLMILNSLADQVIYTPKEDNVLFDRCVLDNLVYTMWLNANGKVSDEFVRKTIKIVRESLVFYDILFFLPITKHSPVPFEQAVNRSMSPQFREEIDHLFKSLAGAYNKGDKTYFPFDHELGSPALIELFGTREERIELAKMYINPDGQIFSEGDSLLTLDEDPQEKPHILEFQ